MAKLSASKALMEAKNLTKRQEYEKAKSVYKAVLEAFPGNKRARNGLAELSKVQANVVSRTPPEETIGQLIKLLTQGQTSLVFKRAGALTNMYPDVPIVWDLLGASAAKTGKLEMAVSAYMKVVDLSPDYAEAYHNLGNVLVNLGRSEEAIGAYKNAITANSEFVVAHNNLGITLKDLGKLDEAKEAFKNALVAKPNYAEVHRNLSAIVTYKTDDTQIIQVRELLENSKLKIEDRCHLHYAYAKMAEDVGEIETAFEHYSAGAALRKNLLAYHPDQDRLIFSRLKNTAPKFESFLGRVPEKKLECTPVFIVGMPRSGTSLVEQIISSHSAVEGAGELKFAGDFGKKLAIGHRGITQKSLVEFRKSYLKALRNSSEGRLIVTDKMPHNFQYLGLICAALPEAKIVHVRREPAATCWSNFKHYFSEKGLGYSYNLDDTVEFFKMYQELMSLWDRRFGDRIYHIDYDRLTIDQEVETKNLILNLELGWEEACLAPQKNARNVRTASQLQVKKPVYSGSSKSWRKFEPYINGVFDELTW